MDPNSLPMNFMDAHPSQRTIDLSPPGAGDQSQSHWSPQQLDITLYALPGTGAEVTRAPPNTSVKLNPGTTTTRP